MSAKYTKAGRRIKFRLANEDEDEARLSVEGKVLMGPVDPGIGLGMKKDECEGSDSSVVPTSLPETVSELSVIVF